MKKSILNLGKALNKAEQKNILGNGPTPTLQACQCFITPGIPDSLPCDWEGARHLNCEPVIRIV
ncbi:hypothetical protein [Tenacibaculum haliotis]|uniref:hypothetical protein n=1 Tax=Tenacibaculum haliotis TaxID=1888914 RepID=UPI0021AF5940|nr:hypothetical protein [Tenacibaculum haliotis]MCT4699667.1 hypothetical protein [Tenacibaculum haliotis]